MLYSIVKLVHVLSAMLLVGAGAITAFFLWRTHRSRDTRAISVASAVSLQVEWWIVVPTVVLQPLTGFWMLDLAGQPAAQPWVVAALVLYALAGVAWAPALVLKFRMRDFSAAAAAHDVPLPASFHRWLHWWFALWWTIFLLTLAILALMVFRPAF